MSDAPEYVHREAAAIDRDRYRLQQTDADIPLMEQQITDLQTALADVHERLGKARETSAQLRDAAPLRVEALRLLCEAHGWDIPQPPAAALNGTTATMVFPAANQPDNPAGNTMALRIPGRGHR